jgi:glycine betaine/proline transport system substrate-binding protein
MILSEFVPADRAVRDWMFRNPNVVAQWLEGITNRQGQPVDAAKLAADMQLTFSR